MDRNAAPTLTEHFAAAQDWWRDAGVDHVFADVTANWLEEQDKEAKEQVRDAVPAVKPAAPAVVPKRPRIGGNSQDWPQSLESFSHWWLTEPSLGTGGRPRIAPRGSAQARLMILILEPEAADEETLLSGPQGKLLEGFMRAAGLVRDEVYFASVLPRHTPLADWNQLAQDGIGDVLLHHIALASPQRIAGFGRGILPLVGHDPAQSGNSLLQINHLERSFPLLIERNLDFLIARPAARAGFWQRWLDWTDGLT